MADSGTTERALAVIRQTGDHMPMWRTRLAELLLADADDLAASMIDAVAQQVDAPQLFNRPEQVQQVARAMAGLIQALAGWMVDPRPEMADAELARSQATGDLTGRTGVPLPDLLAGHRIALAHLQQLLVARSEDWADSATETAEGLALHVLLSEALIPHVTNAHAAGARRARRRSKRRAWPPSTPSSPADRSTSRASGSARRARTSRWRQAVPAPSASE